jgi:hypothetical protein
VRDPQIAAMKKLVVIKKVELDDDVDPEEASLHAYMHAYIRIHTMMCIGKSVYVEK